MAAASLAFPLARQEMISYHQSRRTLDEIVAATIADLDINQPGAKAHAERVSALAVETARRLGMPPQALETLRVAAWLRDVDVMKHPRVTGTEDGPTGVVPWEPAHSVRWAGAQVFQQLPNRDVATIVSLYR